MKKIFYSMLTTALLMVMQASAQQAPESNRTATGFNSVASSVPFTVYIKVDGTESLKIVGDETAINDIETKVEKETLVIRFKQNTEHHKDYKPTKIYVGAKQLASLINSSSGNIKVEGTINGDKFNAIQSGSGNIKIDGTVTSNNFSAVLSGSGTISTDLKAQDLHATISGSGSLNVSGSAGNAEVVISGSGMLRGNKLDTQTTSAMLSGSGYVAVTANKAINAQISGSGGVYYTGNATVTSTTSGSGRVRKSTN